MRLRSDKKIEAPLAATSGASESTNPEKVIDMKNTLADKTHDFTIFRFGKNEIRVIDKDGDPWFVAQDVCVALNIQNVSQAIERLDEDERSMLNIGRQGNANIVSESGMYTLVLRCRGAVNKGSVPHKFRKWVTAEVLPSIRKHGIYEKPVALKKDHQSSATQLTPLRQTAERLITTGMGRIYPDIWKLVHKQFEVKHIHQLTPSQVGEAVEYLNALEGEYLAKANKQMALPISFPMSYFEKYTWMQGIDEHALSAPWRFPANMLTPNGDNPNPLGKMLSEMRQMGYEVEAALFQLLSLQHHLENLRQKIGIIERAIGKH